MYKPGGTIHDLLQGVADHYYILPAIQREFVWGADQICQLFDSLMQGYPFGTFLFWTIEPEQQSQYQFYDFVQHFHQRDNYHCELITGLPHKSLTAVLDGQQRMTALNIGLRGSYAWRISGKWWTNDAAFPVRHLHLNLLGQPDSETGSQFQFEFLSAEQLERASDDERWFRISRTMDEDRDDLVDELDDLIPDSDARKKARKTLRQLHDVIHIRDVVSYYEETNQDLERVLNIFIRMNSGGTALSYSDLLLSIAVAQWRQLDARQEIHALVDEMNAEGDGFAYSKDLVLKAGLMLADIGSVGFKVENFNKANMARLEEQWQAIRSSLILAVRLLASFGFNGQNLRASSAILPIAYYLHARTLDDRYLSRSEFAADREAVRKWLVRSLLKASGIWGSGLDTLLTDLREVLRAEATAGFPVQDLEEAMARRGKSLTFSGEEIDELCEVSYGDKTTFALLSILFPGFDYSQHFHVDHIFPKGRFTRSKLIKAGFTEEQVEDLIEKCNRLPNLQLLVGTINNEKRQKMPAEWYRAQWPNETMRNQYLQHQAIQDLPEDLGGFLKFYKQRRTTLRTRIEAALA
ncbi:DUF262 domain-containing protein [Spectribacter hydrogenoxidans]|uniref:DUF262 domain-containing protein n=1 Tax=Spectribacter hydrogenoxidans TaxID=3075608 RepID=A0ABU3C4B2_9GAMM|nr:DUF262 domain-containing protein [Salinisphaera sp. W335]MDT0636384.1 DUF262 domain-containing protein [Salinisphaera sp. W335]